jgi:type III secretion protein F
MTAPINATEYREKTLEGYEGDTTFLSTMSDNFTKGATELRKEYKEAFEEVKKNSSDPAALAAYQAKLAEYTLYRQAQSQAVKSIKDTVAATIRNWS